MSRNVESWKSEEDCHHLLITNRLHIKQTVAITFLTLRSFLIPQLNISSWNISRSNDSTLFGITDINKVWPSNCHDINCWNIRFQFRVARSIFRLSKISQWFGNYHNIMAIVYQISVVNVYAVADYWNPVCQ